MERERKYREYTLLDLVVKPRDPDLYEYAFLHGFLDPSGREEAADALSVCLQSRWEALGWHFHRSWCGSREDVKRRLRADIFIKLHFKELTYGITDGDHISQNSKTFLCF